MPRVFLEVGAGDKAGLAAQAAEHERAVAYLAEVHPTLYVPAAAAELTDEQQEMVSEMYNGNPSLAEKGPISFTKPEPFSCGRLVIELDTAKTPKAAENFLSLCKGDKGKAKGTDKPLHFKGCPFHRLEPDFVQGGDITRGDGSGGASIWGKKFKDEAGGLAKKHAAAGVVGYANSGKNSNSSQFYVTFRAKPQLDGKHVVFGQVVEGVEEVLPELEKRCVAGKGQKGFVVEVLDCGAV